MTNAEWALAYAKRGLTIFPVWWIDDKGRCACGTCEAGSRNAGKHPIIAGGFKHATTDPAIVALWFAKHPKANIGCLPGASGYVVLDLDGPQGQASAQALGLLSEPTLEVQSGRADGGRHRWYTHPGGAIGNAALAKGIDVRADGGYVILPPSKHYTGNLYQWLGRFDDVAALPDAIVARLRSPGVPVATSTSAADPIALSGPSIKDELLAGLMEGGRNNALTRYAGRLFAKGLTLDEVQVTLLGVNQSACNPPLPVPEVLRIARNIGASEARSGVVRGPSRPVEAVSPAPRRITLAEAREAAFEGALAILNRRTEDAIPWWTSSVNDLMGPMLPGELHVLGALSGNGKTTAVLSQINFMRLQRIPTLYVPLELDPSIALLAEAAFMLGYDHACVLRGQWERLPRQARDIIETQARELKNDPCISYVPDKVLDSAGLIAWMQDAKQEIGARVVVADHIHRMDTGGRASDARINLNGLVKRLADALREQELVGIATAQLNRNNLDGLDAYKPPTSERIKETNTLVEEAWTVSMLSRALRSTVSADDFRALKQGQINADQLASPNVMVWTCRKHRLDGDARDRSRRLRVERGRVIEPPLPVRPVMADYKEAACN